MCQIFRGILANYAVLQHCRDGGDAEPLQEPRGEMRQGQAGGGQNLHLTVQRLGQGLALFKSISSNCRPWDCLLKW